MGTHRLSAKGKAQHLPLGKALQEYADDKNKAQLLQLLLPVQKGTKESLFLKALVESGEIFHPLAWTPQEALSFLRDIPIFESSGVIVRVPDWWKTKKPPRPTVSVTVGGKKASILGLDSMLEFSVNLTLDGERLTEKERRQILASTSGLALIRGKWIEIDHEKLTEVLDHWKSVERAAAEGGISFIEGMRLFGQPGLVLHGGTAVKNRKALVDAFQDERGAPFFVLSLKAGGTGLNLTAASHVIHFDRWWNPAVENQATDRAYRIGQKHNVLVHKFICRGTIEEKIDEMISAKQSLSQEVLAGCAMNVFAL